MAIVTFRDYYNGLNRSVSAACNIYFLKTINYFEVQKHLFGINGLTHPITTQPTFGVGLADVDLGDPGPNVGLGGNAGEPGHEAERLELGVGQVGQHLVPDLDGEPGELRRMES